MGTIWTFGLPETDTKAVYVGFSKLPGLPNPGVAEHGKQIGGLQFFIS